MNEQTFDVSVELVNLPEIKITGYEDIKTQAEELATMLKGIEVNEENLQASKKVVAEVRKKYNELDNNRKQIKKTLLGSMSEINENMKELETILSEGETTVRSKISELEQAQRDERKKTLEVEFERLKEYYGLISDITFQKVLNTKWLNKSTSLKKAKMELQDTLNKINTDYKLILSMVPEDDRVPCVYEFTKNGFDVTQVLNSWKEKQERLAILKKEVKEDAEKPRVVIKPTAMTEQEVFSKTLVIYGREDLGKVMRYMSENKIQFKQI